MKIFETIMLWSILGLSIYGTVMLGQQLHAALASYISSVMFFG